MTDLAGNHALVTGGGTGIGAAIALSLVKAGAKVTIAGRREGPLDNVAAQADNIKPVPADVTDEGSVEALFEAARAAFGPITIVIANAGAAESAPLARVDLAHWQRMLAVNLTGVFLTCRAGLKDMREGGWGRIVTVASTAGLKGYAYAAPYCAAKHGVIGLTRALAAETANENITVNAVCPGFAETPLLEASIRNIVQKTSRTEEEARAALANPQGRLVQPEEVAETVLWLCAAGSRSLTGQAISISGGEA
ncbi:SDR family oxidoreductase [bacterium AH-315-P15]|nr:SDR family oxidoreductase [bacterium AH-315-P15]